MNKSNWDDIRFVLAVAESGSVNTAAQTLGVTHATVLRRVASFEERHGRKIFARAATGYRLLPGSEAILRAAREVEAAVFSVDRAVSGTDRDMAGPVRITSTDSLSQMILPAIISDIVAEFPQMDISLLSGNSHLDLSRLSADISIRPAISLTEGMIGRVANQLHFGVYASHPTPKSWLRLEGSLGQTSTARWMKDNLDPSLVIGGADSFLVLRQMARHGDAAALLPRFVGDAHGDLFDVSHLAPSMSVPIWVAGQEDTRENTRFRMVRDRLAAGLAALW